MPPVTGMLGKYARWAVWSCHLSQECRGSVSGGMYDVSTCHGNVGKVWQVDGMMLPPVTEMLGKCGRWAVRCCHLSWKCCESVAGGRCAASTCHGNVGNVCQVGCPMMPPVTEMREKCARWAVRCFHLSQKCGKSVPGGRCDDATCHGNAGKVCQVGGAIAGLELPDRNIAYLNLPDREIADVKFPDRAIAGLELPDRNITYLKFPTGKLHV